MEYDHYLSPFSWRYGSQDMRQIWSERNKRLLWRTIWVALAETQAEYGLVSPADIDELRQNSQLVDIPAALALEAEIHHDLMAELKTYASQCPHAGRILHLGATSMDIEDNADALRIQQSLNLIQARLRLLLQAFADQIEATADLPVMAFTHLQPAEPTTLGYRLSSYAQDLLADWQTLRQLKNELRGKGFKGAVGNAASYAELIGTSQLDDFEQRLSQRLGLPFFTITTQTYPRKQEYSLLAALAGLGASLYKFCFDLRLLQSPPIGECSEPFGERQIGSSAMPFKRNPIQAEKVDSLARLLAQMPAVAWQNAAHSLLERTLDDSANRRTLLAESFLICDEILLTTHKLISGLQINRSAIQRNLATYGPFAATERVLMALVKAGADRQEMHEHLRKHALQAWQAIQNGSSNPLYQNLLDDPLLSSYLNNETLSTLLHAEQHLGFAPNRARHMVSLIRQSLEEGLP
jgi:adenylosuccinate lyase